MWPLPMMPWLTTSYQMSAHVGGPMWPFPIIHWTSLYRNLLALLPLWTWDLSIQGPPATTPGYGTSLNRDLLLVISGGFKLVHLRTLSPPMLTSGSYWSMYSWQVRGTHLIGMLSFFKHFWNFLRGQWYSCFGLPVTSLGFKARVGSLIHAWRRHT